jgi:DNA excision repair protein ERCC-5
MLCRPGQQPLPDSDQHEFHRHMALAGIGKRRTPKKTLTPLSTKSQKIIKQRAQPLFDAADSDEDFPVLPAADDDDPTIQLALQESLESQEDADMQRALEASRSEFQERQSAEATSTVGSSLNVSENGEELNVPGRLETALAIANAGPTPKSISMTQRLSSSFPETSVFNAPRLLIDLSPSPDISEDAPLEYLDVMDEVAQTIAPVGVPRTAAKTVDVSPGRTALSISTEPDESRQVESVGEQVQDVDDSDEDMEPVPISTPEKTLSAPTALLETPKSKDVVSIPRSATKVHFDDDNLLAGRKHIATTPSSEPAAQHLAHEPVLTPDSEELEEHVISDWSRSPSPVADSLLATETTASKATTIEDSWDAAQEMDPHAEEGEFARFLSQVKGKDLDVVRHEIDEEIKTLNQQKKAAMRDSEDITQQMIAQIMVRSYYACPQSSDEY